MNRSSLFEVWVSAENTLQPGPRFRLLADAIRYVESQPSKPRLAIRAPDGHWYGREQGIEPLDSEPEQILVVEDDEAARTAIVELLRDEGYLVEAAVDGREAVACLERAPADLILTDLMMPRLDGFGLIHRLRERPAFSETPILIMSALHEVSDRVRGLELGADDYVAKPLSFEELLARVRRHLRRTQRTREIVARSGVDELTGVLNRGGLLSVLESERRRAERSHTPLALFVVDIDHFKSINDSFGHIAGDEVLRQIAVSLASLLRSSDSIARYGGDEFVIVAPNTDPQSAQALAQRIQVAPGVPVQLREGRRLSVSVSAGFCIDDGALTAEDQFRRADAAMYQQKRRHALA